MALKSLLSGRMLEDKSYLIRHSEFRLVSFTDSGLGRWGGRDEFTRCIGRKS